MNTKKTLTLAATLIALGASTALMAAPGDAGPESFDAHVASHRSIAGGLIGGIAGGLLGAQVGDGTGRVVAAVTGATAGAIIGERLAHGSPRAHAGGPPADVRTPGLPQARLAHHPGIHHGHVPRVVIVPGHRHVVPHGHGLARPYATPPHRHHRHAPPQRFRHHPRHRF